MTAIGTPLILRLDQDAKIIDGQSLTDKSVVYSHPVELHRGAKSILDAAADIQEEAGALLSAKLGGDLATRKLQDDYGTVSEVQALVEEYLKKIPDLEKQKLTDFVNNLTKQNVTVSEQLLAYLKSYSTDVSEQFVALSEAKKLLTGKPEAAALLTLIDISLTQMAKEKGPYVRAGLIIYNEAAEFNRKEGIGDLNKVRRLYRHTVLDFVSLKETAKYILTQFPEAKFENTIDFLFKALSADLQVQGSSIDKNKLTQTIGDIKKLFFINGLRDHIEIMFAKVNNIVAVEG